MAAASSCYINIVFTPSALGPRSATVSITDNSSNGSPQTISLSGAGAGPVPFVSQALSPASAAPGGPAFTLTVNGANFLSASVVDWNGSPRSTTFISSSRLTASITAADIAAPGTALVTVVNPNLPPEIGASNPVTFQVASPSPSVLFTRADLTAGNGPQAVVFGDFNNDGKLDAVVVNSCGGDPTCLSQGTVSLLLGNGSGGFALQSTTTVDYGPVAAVVGDFNGDGKLDLAVVNSCGFDTYCYSDSAGSVSILLGNGDGTFTPAAEYEVDDLPESIAVGDFNGDGILDLAVANFSNEDLTILFGNGNGTFNPSGYVCCVNTPSSVVAGDFNGDGILDLAVASYTENGIYILQGQGNGQFSVGSLISTGNGPASLVAGDFNGDGVPDLAVANMADNSLTVLLNNQGNFTVSSTPATGLSPHSVATGDVNGDGKLDLVVANEGDNTLSVLLGNGDGTFQVRANFPTGNVPTWAALGDFNGDGRLDVGVPNYQDNTVSFFIQEPVAAVSPASLGFGNQLVGATSASQPVTLSNTGSGLLSISGITITGANSTDFAQSGNCGPSLGAGLSCTINVTITPSAVGLRSATLNITDNSGGVPNSVQMVALSGTGIAPAITFSPTSLTFANQLVGTTSAPQTIMVTSTGTAPLNIASVAPSGDFAVVNDLCSGSSLSPSSTCTFGVTFTPTQTGSRSGTVTITDNVSPGTQTIPLSGTGSSPDNPVPLINQPLVPDTALPGGAAFTLTVNGTGFVNGATVDWNGSSRTTVVVSSSQLTAAINAADIAVAGTVSMTVFNPTPGGGTSNVVFFPITNPTASVSFANANGSPVTVGGFPIAVAVGDFNGDGKLDLAVASAGTNNVTILLGNGDGSFTLGSTYAAGANPLSIVVGDFNGDGKPDLAIANKFSNNVTILLGNGDGTFTPSASSPSTGNQPNFMIGGDFNGDGRLDLAVPNGASNNVTILLGNGDGTFTPAASSPGTGLLANAVATGDFNGDGKLDLAVANYNSNTLTILLGNGDGTFTAAPSQATGSNPAFVAAGDFNGDGKLDLAVVNASSKNVTILLGNGDGTFTPSASSPATGASPFWIAAADFNGDGKLDLAVTNAGSNTVTILLGNGNGTFAPAAVAPGAGASPLAVAAGDFNGDGRLDLAIANNSSANVSVLLQAPFVSTSPASLTFPNQLVGTTSAAQTVTLTNSGSGTLTITSVVSSGDFALTNNTCPASLAPAANCTFGVTFTPTATGTRTGAATLTDNAANSPQTVALTGTGVAPAVTLAPTSLTYATQSVGTTSAAQTVTLTNTGSGTLTITSIVPSGDFAVTNNTCPASLPGLGLPALLESPSRRRHRAHERARLR